MAEKQPKDRWDKFGLFAQAAIPVVLGLGGYFFSAAQSKHADLQAQADLFEKMIGHLTSGNQAEQTLAIKAMPILFAKDAQQLIPLVSSLVDTTTDRTVAKQAVATLTEITNGSDTAQATIAKQGLAQIASAPSRLYIQIESESERAAAAQLQSRLQADTLSVKGVENVKHKINVAELRFFSRDSEKEAQAIAARVGESGIKLQARFVSLHEGPKNQYELWLNEAALKVLDPTASATASSSGSDLPLPSDPRAGDPGGGPSRKALPRERLNQP